MVDKAGGDMGYTAAFMLLASVATVVYMPLAVPVLVKGFSAGAWTIAKPLLFFLLVPLAIGTAIQFRSPSVASRFEPIVKKVTAIDTLLMLVACVVIYGKAFLGLAGSYAIGAQILFFSVAAAGPSVCGLRIANGSKDRVVARYVHAQCRRRAGTVVCRSRCRSACNRDGLVRGPYAVRFLVRARPVVARAADGLRIADRWPF